MPQPDGRSRASKRVQVRVLLASLSVVILLQAAVVGPSLAAASPSPGCESWNALGTSGWHYHPGVVLVVVESGHVTTHDANCQTKTYGPGQAFVESGGEVHLARNAGSTPVELNATFLARPGTSDFVIPQRQPRVCHV